MRVQVLMGSRRLLPYRRQILAEALPFDRLGCIDLTHEPPPQDSVDVEAVSGACMLIRRSALDEVGGFDPGFYMHFEDLDLMARLQSAGRSEEHTSELQSRGHLVCRLLLEKKKKKTNQS